MKTNILHIICAVAAFVAATFAVKAYDTDEDMRLDGYVEVTEPKPVVDYTKYPFLHLKANKIDLNGADWSHLQDRAANINDTIFSIVHIGDSHLQAEGATSVTRQMLQTLMGSSGRGLITPLKLAGTNQPYDYTITSRTPMEKASVMRRPWAVPVGFTGVALSPKARDFDFTIATKEINGMAQDFDCIKVFCSGVMPEVLEASSPEFGKLNFDTKLIDDTLDIWLTEPVTSVSLDFRSAGKCSIYGFKLENSMMGLEYHVIGNNGARYDTYNTLGNMGRSVRALSPNLIIVSLGANEAFGKITDASFYNNIDWMVTDLKRHNPEAEILLVTPGECQRSTRGRGGKIYQKNADIERLRNVLLQYGRDNNVATYDWFDVAGGDGSSQHWVDNELLSRDRIHNTITGYQLQGTLMYDALVKAIYK